MTHRTYSRRHASRVTGETLMMIVGASLAFGSLAILTAYLAFAVSHDCKFVSTKGTALQHLCTIVGF